MPAADPFRTALARLGLGRHEATLYATLVERSPLGASSLAKATGLARSSVYTALASLTARGLVGTTHEEGVKRFVAEGHAALLDAMRREEERARERAKLAAELAPHFAAREAGGERRLPHVVHFEGIEGLKRVYLTMLRQAPRGATMSILRDEFLWTPEWAFVSSSAWRKRVRALRAPRAIDTRLLVNPSPIEREQAAGYRARPHLAWRFLPEAMRVSRFAIYVLGDVVAVMSTEAPDLVGIQIANANLASNFGAIFEGLWTIASDEEAPPTKPRRRRR
ncbi:MAG: helix-turn-helix domain-containing protein [Sandaracinaceae bacterium]|nr:helix-turn-helix domain-containing protein [Sandaracinaceae bacterium]